MIICSHARRKKKERMGQVCEAEQIILDKWLQCSVKELPVRFFRGAENWENNKRV